MNETISGKTLLIYFGILLFIGFLAGKTLLESAIIVLVLYGSLFAIAGLIICIIWLVNK